MRLTLWKELVTVAGLGLLLLVVNLAVAEPMTEQAVCNELVALAATFSG